MEDTHDYIPDRKPVTCRSITATEAIHKDFHFYGHYEIYLLLEGEIAYYVEQSRCPMKPGDLILFTNQGIHRTVDLRGIPYTRIVIHIDPLYVQQFCTSQTNLLRCPHQHRPGVNNVISLTLEQLALFQECFHQIEESQMPEEYRADIQGIAAPMRSLLTINETPLFPPDQDPEFYFHRLQLVMAYINSHLAEPITLDSIAQVCSLDKYYLSHLSKRETGSTIFQCVLVKRIAMVRGFLSVGTSVAEICVQPGFGDHINFIRTSKKVTGNSPGHSKKVNRGAF